MILDERQREELIDFTPNFVKLLQEAGFSREQAAEAVHSSLACLFGVIWKVPTTVPLSEEDKKFVLTVQVLALRQFYGEESKV